MQAATIEPLNSILESIGLNGQSNLLSIHLGEIEDESNNVLDLLTTLRAHAYRSDQQAGQESLAELTIALEHLLHHVKEVVPELQKQLDIDDEDIL